MGLAMTPKQIYNFNSQDRSALSLLDFADALLSTLMEEGPAELLALPAALGAAIAAVVQIPSNMNIGSLHTAIIACAILGGYAFTRLLFATARLRAQQVPVPFIALLKQAGYELTALAVCVVIGRVLLIRWLNMPLGANVFPAEATVSLIRWVFAVAIANFFFQPSNPSLRFVRMDDAGAVRAVRWTAILIAIGHVHSVLLTSAVRTGFAKENAKTITILIAILMLAGAISLLLRLRRNGLMPLPFWLGLVTLLTAALLWIWGARSGDISLFRGLVITISILVLGWTFDQVIALSILASRRPEAMRRLVVVRVVLGALILTLITRILLEFWFGASQFLFGAEGWGGFSRRLNLASFILVSGIFLSAFIHVWVQSRLTPAEGEVVTPEIAALRARLSTILPIIQFSAIGTILLVTALIVLSVLGVDITGLMAAAGILGLAISLGSQALVKDIVSGLLYMFDDVFRVGELIESKEGRGHIEHISMRSVHLRDDEDRLHTIPFGDLGTVTNLSRRLVNMKAQVNFRDPVKAESLASLARSLVSAMRSEKLLQTWIVGPIDISIPSGTFVDEMTLSFRVAAGLAPQVETVSQILLVSELQASDISRGKAELRIIDTAGPRS